MGTAIQGFVKMQRKSEMLSLRLRTMKRRMCLLLEETCRKPSLLAVKLCSFQVIADRMQREQLKGRAGSPRLECCSSQVASHGKKRHLRRIKKIRVYLLSAPAEERKMLLQSRSAARNFVERVVLLSSLSYRVCYRFADQLGVYE